MSKAKSESAVHPTIIDLDAETVIENGPAAAGSTAETPATAKQSRSGATTWLALALVGGLVGGGYLYRNVLATYLPDDAMAALQSQVQTLDAQNKSAEALIKTHDSAIAEVKTELGAISGAVKQSTELASVAQAQSGALVTRLDGLDASIAKAREDLAALQATLNAAGTGGDAAVPSPAVIVALTQRVEALEKDIASLKQGAGEKTTDTAALSQSISDIKAKIAAGVAYRAELDRVARMVPAADGLDVLAKFADAGLPNAAGLAIELKSLATTLPTPEQPAPPASDSYWDQITAALGGLITIRSLDAPDWNVLATKAVAFAETGDLDQAVQTLAVPDNMLPPGLDQWRTRAMNRQALEAALTKTAEAVLREIAARG